MGMSNTEPSLSARSSLLNVLTKPRPSRPQHAYTSHSATTTSSLDTDNHSSNEDDFSDQSTISSYASSVISSRTASSEELAKVYKNYLERPFVGTNSPIKHSEFGHCNNPNWRWTSQWNPNEPIHPEEEARPPYFILLTTYMR